MGGAPPKFLWCLRVRTESLDSIYFLIISLLASESSPVHYVPRGCTPVPDFPPRMRLKSFTEIQLRIFCSWFASFSAGTARAVVTPSLLWLLLLLITRGCAAG